MITLATLEAATAQEVFDQVAAHLLAQGAKSLRENACAMRGQGGRKCAAGCLVSDGEYSRDLEITAWDALCSRGRVPTAHRELIISLQEVHDRHRVEMWPAKLFEVAVAFRLQRYPWRI